MNAIVPNKGSFFLNLIQRSLATIAPGSFTGQKHDHYKDFGFPATVDFNLLYAMYTRNSLAKSAVDKTIRKTWQDLPWLLEKPRDGSEGAVKKETRIEKAIRQHFTAIRFWSKVMEADRRSLVGAFGGVILRVADGKPTDKPLTKVRNGLNALVDIIPFWEGQMKVTKWDTDQKSLTYGDPLEFQYDEGSFDARKNGTIKQNPGSLSRQLTIHPSRVVIWSQDGSMDCEPALKAGINDLISIEKIVGAGGEGFWKNAKQAPILEMDKEADILKMAKAMGVDPKNIADIMNDQVAGWQKGFDELLMVQGMTAKLPKVELPDPEHFFMNALQSFAASFDIPLKVLVGTQTGERAATEDASQWNQTCNFRRKNTVVPNILLVIKRLENCGILKENPEWFIDWTDLTESTMLDKIDRAGKMAKVNKDNGTLVFLPTEIRAAVGYEPNEEELIKEQERRQSLLTPPKDPNNPDEEDSEGEGDETKPKPKDDPNAE